MVGVDEKKEARPRLQPWRAWDVYPEQPEMTMEVSMIETQAMTRARRRPSAKASREKDGPKVKATLLISAEASKKLSVHAAYMGEDRSTLVNRLILDHLRRFVVSDREKPADRATDEVSASGAGQ